MENDDGLHRRLREDLRREGGAEALVTQQSLFPCAPLKTVYVLHADILESNNMPDAFVQTDFAVEHNLSVGVRVRVAWKLNP